MLAGDQEEMLAEDQEELAEDRDAGMVLAVEVATEVRLVNPVRNNKVIRSMNNGNYDEGQEETSSRRGCSQDAARQGVPSV